MLKIDLHIHTVRTDLDPQNFDFDLKLLQDYVSRAALDAIAITNHNTFSMRNFKEIQQSIPCAVFPGIEVNVATPGGYGHALVIAPTDDLEDFAKDALALESKFGENNGRLSWADISDGFRNIVNYLVIPHYKKAKQLDLQTISSIRETTGIDALEVAGPKKWLREDRAAPEPIVSFSDSRPGLKMSDEGEDGERRYAYGCCYVDCNEASVASIKLALKTEHPISIFKEDSEFEVLPEGLPVSKQLNVLVGRRSSGKTYTLKRIKDGYGSDDCAYIKQFEITSGAEEGNFKERIAKEDKSFQSEYLQPLQDSMLTCFNDDYAEDMLGAIDWCEKLIVFANSPEDDISKLPIYTASEYSEESSNKQRNSDFELSKSVLRISNEKTRANIVREHVNLESLALLDAALREIERKDYRNLSLKNKTDEVTRSIQLELKQFSARDPLPPLEPLRKYFMEAYRKHRLCHLLENMEAPEELESEADGKFKRIRKRALIKTAKEGKSNLPKTLSKGMSVTEVYKSGADWQKRLDILRESDEAIRSQAAHLFFKVDSSVVVNDEKNTPLSGGQRAEYLFLHLLGNAHGKEMVLIDEPESSFDNEFLRDYVIPSLRDLAKHSTVFVVTHNNTLGVSLEADRVIYAEFEPESGYRLYSGHIASQKLTDELSGDAVLRGKVLMDTMEAGKDAYERRSQFYETA